MYDNYPPGAANDPHAPYNQPLDPEPIDTDVCVSITLSKTVTVPVDDYVEEAWEDWDVGDEGETIHTGGVDYDFSNSDLLGAFKAEEYTIPELLDQLKIYITNDINNTSDTKKIVRLQNLLNACDDWTVDEEVAVEG